MEFFFQKMSQKACTTIVRKVKDNFSMIKVIFFYYWFIIILILLLNWIMWTLVVFFSLVRHWMACANRSKHQHTHPHTHTRTTCSRQLHQLLTLMSCLAHNFEFSLLLLWYIVYVILNYYTIWAYCVFNPKALKIFDFLTVEKNTKRRSKKKHILWI